MKKIAFWLLAKLSYTLAEVRTDKSALALSHYLIVKSILSVAQQQNPCQIGILVIWQG
jgi:hypothetical protein